MLNSIKEIYKSVKNFPHSLDEKISEFKYKDCILAILLGIDMLIYIFMLAFGIFFYKANDWNELDELLNKGCLIPIYVLALFVLLLWMFLVDLDRETKSNNFLKLMLCGILAFIASLILFLTGADSPFLNSFEWSTTEMKWALFIVIIYYTFTIYMRLSDFANVLRKAHQSCENYYEKREESNK